MTPIIWWSLTMEKVRSSVAAGVGMAVGECAQHRGLSGHWSWYSEIDTCQKSMDHQVGTKPWASLMVPTVTDMPHVDTWCNGEPWCQYGRGRSVMCENSVFSAQLSRSLNCSYKKGINTFLNKGRTFSRQYWIFSQKGNSKSHPSPVEKHCLIAPPSSFC